VATVISVKLTCDLYYERRYKRSDMTFLMISLDCFLFE